MSSSSLALSLARLRRLPREGLTVGTVVDRLAQQSAALVLLLAGTLAVIPSPGLPVGLVFGSLAALVALRMLVRRAPLRLPRNLAQRPMPGVVLDLLASRAVPLLRRIERRTRARHERVASGLGARLAYLMVALQSVLVSLPIPFGNTVPGIAIVLIAFGLARRDGLVTLAGHVVGLVALAASAAVVGVGYAAIRYAS